MKRTFKLLTIIFFLLMVIPNEKVAFPVILIIFLNFMGGLWGILLSFTAIGLFGYLIYSTNSNMNNNTDDIITILIILSFYSLLLTQINSIYYNSDLISGVSIFLFLTVSISTIYFSILDIRRRPS